MFAFLVFVDDFFLLCSLDFLYGGCCCYCCCWCCCCCCRRCSVVVMTVKPLHGCFIRLVRYNCAGALKCYSYLHYYYYSCCCYLCSMFSFGSLFCVELKNKLQSNKLVKSVIFSLTCSPKWEKYDLAIVDLVIMWCIGSCFIFKPVNQVMCVRFFFINDDFVVSSTHTFLTLDGPVRAWFVCVYIHGDFRLYAFLCAVIRLFLIPVDIRMNFVH